MTKICLLLLLMTFVKGQDEFIPEPLRKFLTDTYLMIRRVLQHSLGSDASSGERIKAAMDNHKILEPLNKSVPFPCNVSVGKSPEVPSSVHRLRPGDINIIGAIGDSLTAAFGALSTNPLELIRENRGISAVIGGQGTWREYSTLPNILKNYNPKLFGFSLGDGLSFEWVSQFNVADGTALTPDMPFMATKLINRLRNDSRVDMDKHWKLISLLIGANDYCWDMCYNNETEYLKTRRQWMIKTLDILRDNLPRTIINLVLPPDVGRLLSGFPGRSPFRCTFFQGLECPCIMGSRWTAKQNYYRPLVVKGLNMDIELASLDRYDRDDFTVVATPLLINMTVPKLANGQYDVTFMTYDCFHLSPKGHSRAGISLWNNLLQPVGQKSAHMDMEDDKITCVTPERPYIYTRRNSQ